MNDTTRLPVTQPDGHERRTSTARFVLSANARMGEGGQGEILRQMVRVYERLPESRVFARAAAADGASSIRPRTFPYAHLFRGLQKFPYLRGRVDWLMLLSDLDFDAQVSARVETPDLFEGVMGQCARTMARLEARSTKRLLYALNTHIGHLERVLRQEHERLGISMPTFVHPRMRERALREIQSADSIRVLSETAKATFVGEGVPATKVHVVHPCIDHGHFRPVEQRDAVFRVMSSSSVDARKGIYYLLQAFAAAQIPNSELVIIGGTGDRWAKRMLDAFRQRHRNVRQCIVNVMGEPLERHFGQASVVVHPAIEDGFALTIPQALACGKPVIATRQSGASELLRDGHDGFVVEARDVGALTDRLKLLASDVSLRRSMSAAAPRAVAHLTEAAFGRAVLDYYGRVLNRPVP